MDRLSDLPDSLICHILSFLPTKLSAAMSVLSKRWRYLWNYIPVSDLHIRYHESINPWGHEFSDIINKVLMCHNHGDLQTFHLTTTWDPHYNFTDNQIETWMSIVTPRRLRNLHIGLNDLDCYMRLPQFIFTCQTLVELSLHGCKLGRSTMYLPSLRKLHVVEFVFHSEESFSDLISGCPVLEELAIDWTYVLDHFWYSVSSTTIKCIKIVHTKAHKKDIERPGGQFTLDMDTPALKYLKIGDCLPKYVSGPTQTLLVEADIRFTVHDDEEEGVIFSSISVLEFVDKLDNVEQLYLRLDYVRSLCGWFPVGDYTEVSVAASATSTVWFGNLTKLELAADWLFLLKFLEYAPNLQVLIIRKIDKYLKYCEEPQQVHPCLTSHLTSIILHEFEGTTQDLEMAKYFMRNAKILKTVDIYFRADSFSYNKMKETEKSISLFERGSVACKLRFD